MKLPVFFPVAAGVALVVLSSCSNEETQSLAPASTKPVVHTVNYPLFYFADRIGGKHIDLRFKAPTDGDPAFWEPTDEDLSSMQSANLILANGATYSKWMAHVTLPMSIITDTSKAFADQYITVQGAASHSHGDGNEHSHAGTAFTTWIDFQQAARQAEAVRKALVHLVPEAEAELNANAEALAADLKSLDEECSSAAGKAGDQPLMASHPVYQYFARRYKLNLDSVLWEPETVPEEAAMSDLKKKLETFPAKWMIWEGDPAEESVTKLAEIGLKSIVFDPCGNRPDEGDWLNVMKKNISNLQSISQ